MKKTLPKLLLIAISICILHSGNVLSQRKVEKLGRGVVAVNLGGGQVYISWRLLVSDPSDIAFNIYRSIGGAAATQLNSTPITATTDFSDNSASTTENNAYYVRPVINGVEQAPSKSFVLPGSPTAKRYISIPLQPLAHYSVPHIYPADLDGDGEYDYIVKRLPVDQHNNVMVEAYKSDGTFMWRVDLGPNIEQGASTHNPFILAYDFDGDGKAEVLIRSSEGTVFTDGYTIPDVNHDNISDYRTFPAVNVLSYMLRRNNCPEFLSMVEGTTGKELARTDWIARGDSAQWLTYWGDTEAHRMSMQFIGVAYLDGIHPSIVGSRGPGDVMDVAAWDYSNKQFTKRWAWSARNNASIPSGYHWADFHNIRIADLDGDGKDEISFGVNAMGNNGVPLYYAKNDIGHGDRFVIADLDPDRPGLECYAIQQSTSVLAVLYDAKNGERIKTWSSSAPFDVSRGDAADIDPRYKGMELWSYAHSSVLDCKGNPVPGATTFPHPALSIWWDGDLTRENLDAADGNGYNPIINKWNYATNTSSRVLSLYNEGGQYSTKTPYAGRAALYGDILGDWREEIFCMSADSSEIRIFSTWTPATNRLYCLMQNPEYRACIGPKGYLPSTEVDYYLGVGMTTPPTPPVLTAKSEWFGGMNGNVWDVATNNWKNNDVASHYTEGDTIMFDISGTGNTSVTLNTPVNPGFMIVNSPVDYSITGTGSISGATRLLKSGQGSLTLATTCNYTGKTNIEQGYLYINATLSQSAASVYKDAGIGGSGTITQVVSFEKGAMVVPGTKSTVGTITFSSGLNLPGGNSFLFDITDDASGSTKPSDKIIVTGNLVLTDTNYLVINKINGTVNPGTYPLISYSGTFTGNLNNLIVSGLYGQKVVLSNAAGVISMTVLATRLPEKIVWSGVGANWDLLTSPNWLNNGVSEVFVTGDTVLFNSTGSGQYNVNITEGVSIGDMTVDNTFNDYTFAGTGSIGGTGGLTKTGIGTLTISNANMFTGKLAINGGTLQIGSVANAGTASPIGASTDTVPGLITLSNAELNFTGTGASNTTDHGITLSGNDTINISASSTAQLALKGRLDGTGLLVKTGPGILMFQPATSKNTYSGGTVIKAGTLSLGNDVANANGLGTGTVTLDGGTLSMINTNSSYTISTFNLAVPFGSTGTFIADGRVELYGNLTGGGTLNYNTPYTRTTLHEDMTAFTGQINATGSELRLASTNSYATVSINLGSTVTAYYNTSNSYVSSAQNVTIGELSGVSGSKIQDENWAIGAKNTNATFNGTIVNGSTAVCSITKVGTGTWTLTGANTYTGATTINAGSLIVNNTSGSGTGTGAVAVNSGATLAGTGSIAGAVTVNSGGIISPGNATIDTLFVKNTVTFLAGSNYNVEIDRAGLPKADLLSTTGAVLLNGTLNITNLGAALATGDNFKIITTTSNITGSFGSIVPAEPSANQKWDLSTLNTNGIIRVADYLPQTITLNFTDKQYGDADFSAGASVASGLPLTYSTDNPLIATISASGMIHIVGAGSCTVTVNQAGDATHRPAVVTQALNIAKASLSITVVDTFRYVGAANPAFRFIYSGFVGNDKVSSLSVLPVANCSANSANSAGDYDITLSGGDDKNYTFSYTNGKLTVKVNSLVQTLTEKSLQLYPNPTSGWVYVDLDKNATDAVIEVFNSSGMKIMSVKESGSRISIDLSNHPNGIYMIRIITGTNGVSKMVLKN